MWFLPLVVACTGQSVGQSTKYNNTRTSLTWWHRPSPHPQWVWLVAQLNHHKIVICGFLTTQIATQKRIQSHVLQQDGLCVRIPWASKLVLTRLYLRNLTWGLLLHNLHLHVRFLWIWSFQHRTNNMNHDAAYFHFSSLKLRMEQLFKALLSPCDTVLWHKRFVFDIR